LNVVRKAARASVVVLLVTACSGTHAKEATFRGAGTDVVSATTKGIGFSVPTFPFLSRPEQIAWLKDFRALGITWIRIDVTWAVVQPTRAGPYNWARYNTAIAEADRYGIHVDAQADFSAPWASAPGCHAAYAKCQPANPRLYAAYAAAIARHFGHGISAEEIWNEPNNVAFWHPAPDPAFYASMLKDAYIAIKAVDPQMIVVSGGLAPEPDNGTDISARTFAEDMLRDGAKGYFNAFGYHPYSFPALPDQYEPWSAWSQMAQTRPSIRSIMAANGDGGTPIWITEVGAPTAGPGGAAGCTGAAGTVGRADHDSQCRQAVAIAQVVRDERSLCWLGPAFIYSFQDLGTDQASQRDSFGVRTAAGRAKASYFALKRGIAATVRTKDRCAQAK
jgi:polysaccharide biosynthesis protein PslG